MSPANDPFEAARKIAVILEPFPPTVRLKVARWALEAGPGDEHQKLEKVNQELNETIAALEHEMEEVRNKRSEYQTMFENFDQKANQLFNILSTVMKSMKEMQSSVTRNLL